MFISFNLYLSSSSVRITFFTANVNFVGGWNTLSTEPNAPRPTSSLFRGSSSTWGEILYFRPRCSKIIVPGNWRAWEWVLHWIFSKTRNLNSFFPFRVLPPFAVADDCWWLVIFLEEQLQACKRQWLREEIVAEESQFIPINAMVKATWSMSTRANEVKCFQCRPRISLSRQTFVLFIHSFLCLCLTTWTLHHRIAMCRLRGEEWIYNQLCHC